jgi:hypothetical protein
MHITHMLIVHPPPTHVITPSKLLGLSTVHYIKLQLQYRTHIQYIVQPNLPNLELY